MPFSEFKDFKLHAHTSPPPIIVSSPPASLAPVLLQEESRTVNQIPKALTPPPKSVRPLKSAMRNKEKRVDPKQVHWDSEVVDNEHKMQRRRKSASVRPALGSPKDTHYPTTADFSYPRPFPQAPEDMANSPSKVHHSHHHQNSQTANFSSPRSLPWAPERQPNPTFERGLSQLHQKFPTANTGAARDSLFAHPSVEIGSQSPHVASARSQIHSKEHQIPPRVPDAPKRDSRPLAVPPKSPHLVKPKSTKKEDRPHPRSPIVRRILNPEPRQQEDQAPLISPKPRRSKKPDFLQEESPKPPPTPRPRRLPSPDLPEVGCGQFCECCKIQAPYSFPEPRSYDHDAQKWEYQLENALTYIKNGRRC